jgi:uncharacterized damage-inducible protein DinB
MIPDGQMIPIFFKGWKVYQDRLVAAIAPLTAGQLSMRTIPRLRSVDEIARHIIGARARWFYLGFEVGGDAFKDFGTWDRRDAPPRNADELVQAITATWEGMHKAIDEWTPEEWAQTWPGEDESEPEVVTPHWIIWHLIEHELYHGGEISITLGAHGIQGVEL